MNSKSFKLQKPIFFFFYNKLHQRFQFFMRNSKYFSWVMILAFAIIATNHSVSSRRTRNPFWFRIPSELPDSNQLNFFFFREQPHPFLFPLPLVIHKIAVRRINMILIFFPFLFVAYTARLLLSLDGIVVGFGLHWIWISLEWIWMDALWIDR